MKGPIVSIDVSNGNSHFQDVYKRQGEKNGEKEILSLFHFFACCHGH